jgi:hypothetical protein
MNIPPATSNPENISATGAKGFLQWLRADQPALYMAVVPQLQLKTPEIWSDAEQTDTMTNLGRILARGPFGTFSQDTVEYAAYTTGSSGDEAVSESVAIGQAETAPTTATDYYSELGTSGQEAVNESTTLAAADSANTGPIDPSTTSTISNVISETIPGLTDDASIASSLDSLANQQLQSAAAGLSPTSASSTGSGIPTLSSLASSIGTTGWLLIAGGVALVFALAASG